VHPREDILVAGTHGRGVWAIDVRALQGLTPEVIAKEGHLFDIEKAFLPRSERRWDRRTLKEAYAIYYLKNETDVSVLVRDDEGNMITTLDGTGHAGLNIVSWDLTKPGDEEGETELVDPGKYTLQITVGSEEIEKIFKVKAYSSR
jgi:hypothetical protein